MLITPPPAVIFSGFGADAMNFELRAVVSDINGGTGVISDINHAIARRFGDAGIAIPFTQRDVWLRNGQDITAPKPAADKPAQSEPTATQGKRPV